MKLVSVAKSGEERLGLLARELVVDLLAAVVTARCSPTRWRSSRAATPL